MDNLSSFQRDLLYVVAGSEGQNGLDMKRELEEYYASEINHGRLYPNLNKLEEKGLIEKGKVDQRTNSYSITERGKKVLLERRRWEEQEMGEVPAEV